MRGLQLLVAGVVLAGCAASQPEVKEEQSVFTGAVADTSKLLETMRQVQDLQRESERVCAAFRDRALKSEDEQLLGRGVALTWINRYGVPLAEQSRKVAKIGQALAAHSARPQLPWNFAVVELDKDLELVAPGGYVFLTRATFEKAQSDDELAVLLAHGIAHVTMGSALKREQQLLYTQCVSAKTASGALKLNVELGGFDPALVAFANEFQEDGTLRKGAASASFAAHIADTVRQFGDLMGLSVEDELEADRDAAGLMVFSGYAVDRYADWLSSKGDKAKARVEKFAVVREELRGFQK